MGEGKERIEDPAELSAVRSQAARVLRRATLWAAALTLLSLAIP